MNFRRFRTLAASAVLGMSVVLGTAPAAQAADLEPGTPVQFHDRFEHGYGVVDADLSSSTGTALFTLTVHSDPALTTRAYCIEKEVALDVQNPQAQDARLAGWDAFTGTNRFHSNPVIDGVPTRERVSWIALHSYPAVDLDTLAARAGIAALSAPEAITASQAAIWHLTDGLQLTAITHSHGVDDSSQTWLDVKRLYDYLLGPANTGSPESWTGDDARVSIDGPSSVVAGAPTGPFTVSTNLPSVTVTAGDAAITDADGAPLTGPLANGGTFYVIADEAATGAGIELRASGMRSGAASAIVRTVTTGSFRAAPQQTVILSSADTAEVSAEHPLTVTAPAPEPVPVTVTTKAVPEVEAGGSAHDVARIDGDVPAGSTLSFEVFKQDGPAPVCETPTAATDAVPVPAGRADGLEIASPEVALAEPGTYFWVETLKDADGNVLHRGECGAEGETTIVAEQPAAPVETPKETPAAAVPAPTPAPQLATTGVDGGVGLFAVAGGITAALGVLLMLLGRARRSS